MFNGSYSARSYDSVSFRADVERIARSLARIHEHTPFDFVAVCGKSGIAPTFAASLMIDINIVVVRKEKEASHGFNVEGTYLPHKSHLRYIIVDDLISFGSTIGYINRQLNAYFDNSAPTLALRGVLLYNENCWRAEHGAKDHVVSSFSHCQEGLTDVNLWLAS